MSKSLLWERLERALARSVEEFQGVAGVSVKDLSSGLSLSVNGDEEFPTASTIKIHVLTQLLVRAERGEVDLDSRITVTPEMRIGGSSVLSQLHGDIELTALNLAMLMVTVSDNTATNLCIDMAGMDQTNALLRELGLKKTTLRRRMFDIEAIARGDENVATPNECVAMLAMLHEGKPSPGVARRCLEILKSPKQSALTRALPDLPIANKPGYMGRVYCDAGIVYLPERPYAVAVMTTFGLSEHLEQERSVIDMVREIHRTMEAIAETNYLGLSLPG